MIVISAHGRANPARSDQGIVLMSLVLQIRRAERTMDTPRDTPK